MSAFAVAALHPAHVAVGAGALDVVVRVRATDVGEDGVDVSLRLWTPVGVRVAALRGLCPASTDLLARAVAIDERTLRCAAGRWTDGAHEYELALDLPARAAGDEMLAARVVVVVVDRVTGQVPVAVTWTNDPRLLAPERVAASDSTRGRQELPTGPSPQPRHTPAVGRTAGAPCPSCGLAREDGDRYCERCGRELGGDPQR